MKLFRALLIFSLICSAHAADTSAPAANRYREKLARLSQDKTSITGQICAQAHADDRAFMYEALIDSRTSQRYKISQNQSKLPYTQPLLLLPRSEFPELYERVQQLQPYLRRVEISVAPKRPEARSFMFSDDSSAVICTRYQMDTLSSGQLERQLAAYALRTQLKDKIGSLFSKLKKQRTKGRFSLTESAFAGAFTGFVAGLIFNIVPYIQNRWRQHEPYSSFTLSALVSPLAVLNNWRSHTNQVAADKKRLEKRVEKYILRMEDDALNPERLALSDTTDATNAAHYEQIYLREQIKVLARLVAHHEAQRQDIPPMLKRRQETLAARLTELEARTPEDTEPDTERSAEELRRYLLRPFTRALDKADVRWPNKPEVNEAPYVY